MKLYFEKMHSLGNDFIMVDNTARQYDLTPGRVKYMSDRHFGVGCDQIIVAEQPTQDDYDFFMRIYNQDGSEVEQCGNGARCFGRFVHDHALTDKQNIRVQTVNASMHIACLKDGLVSAALNQANFAPESLPLIVPEQRDVYTIQTPVGDYEMMAASMGNPHAVIQVDDIDAVDVLSIGRAIQAHAWFPNSVNVGFMKVIDEHSIRLRVYERGVGETLGCGSGACAAVSCGHAFLGLGHEVDVNLPGGKVKVKIGADDIQLIGHTYHVFSGNIEI